jgi:predicted GNAT family N-acyltransferase
MEVEAGPAREHELAAALALRHEVFVREQGVPEELETDGRDATALHIVARDARGTVVGTCRLLPAEPLWTLGRMAVAESVRGRGAGASLMLAAHAAAEEGGAQGIALSAQIPVRGFYERFGYRAVGNEYLEAGIRHVRMEHRWTPPG